MGIAHVRMPDLIVAFTNENDASATHWHNRLVRWFTGSGRMHCEMYFEHTDETFTVDVDHPGVYVRSGKSWLNAARGWEFLRVEVAQQAYDAAYAHCKECVGRPFNWSGYYFFFVGPGVFDRGDGYICARLVTETLQAAGVFSDDIDATQMHVGHVHAELCRDTKTQRVGHVGKRRSLEQFMLQYRLAQVPADVRRALGIGQQQQQRL